MKKEFVKAAKGGHVIKSNTFETNLGKYIIDIVFHDGSFYLYKSRDGKIVECNNLTEIAKGVE